MKKSFPLKIRATLLLALAFSIQATAHHGYPQYNMNGPGIALQGTIGSFRMANPHSYITIIVLNENGDEVLWAVETTDTLRGMRQKGFSADTFKPGDEVTLVVSPAINGDRTAIFRSVELGDGTIMPELGSRQ